MDKNKNPIMLAFLVFLIIVIAYNFFSKIFGFGFANWSKIVVATTIATYFFTLAYFEKSVIDILELLLPFCERLKGQYEEFKHYVLIEELEYDDFKEDVLPEVNEQIKWLDERIDLAERSKLKTDKLCYVLSILGFLSFFIIFAFEPVYQWFYSQQEFFTMIAFFLMLFTDYLLTTKKDNLVDEQKTMTEVMNSIIEAQKNTAELTNEIAHKMAQTEEQDGQVEDGN